MHAAGGLTPAGDAWCWDSAPLDAPALLLVNVAAADTANGLWLCRLPPHLVRTAPGQLLWLGKP